MTSSLGISDRLSRLERSNRHLKAALSLCLCCAAALMVMGAASTATKVIDVEKIVLRDSRGNERGQLFASDSSWGLVLFNKNKTQTAGLVVGSELNALLLFDPNGNIRQSFTSNLSDSGWNIFRPGSDAAQFEVFDRPQGTGMSVRDRANNPRVELGWSGKGSALNLSDSRGAVRAAMSGEDLGFVSFSEDGTLKWAPGWDKFSPEEQEKMKAMMPKSPN